MEESSSSGCKRTPPPLLLKLDVNTDCGEKSPKARTVLELFKRYNIKRGSGVKKTVEEKKHIDEGVNVGFDKMSIDEKDGFLKKLKMLTVNSNKKTIRNYSKKQDSPMAENKYSTKQSAGAEQKPKKDAARRLNFRSVSGDVEKKPEFEVSKKEVNEHKNIKKPYKHHASRGSLETPENSPTKSMGSPIKHFQEETNRDSSFADEDNTNRRKRFFSRNNVKDNSCWYGDLPPRDYTSPVFSRKIFVGGVPWDITESALKEAFGEFGSCIVEWPGQEARYRTGGQQASQSTSNSRMNLKTIQNSATGYVYMIYEDERSVARLLRDCSQEIGGAGEWYFKIRAQRSKSTEIRQVQIIPWVTSDSLFCEIDTLAETGIEPKRTVFVGALHGMMTANVLHGIMEDCFGNVECVQLDTDKFKYPIGSGRVTFKDHSAYFKAIETGYLHVQTSKFRKRVQIDPFLESTTCMVCNIESAHCFCRNRDCFKYYCHSCWSDDHNNRKDGQVHIPVIVPSSATKALSNGRKSVSPIKPIASVSAPNQSSNTYTTATAAFPLLVAPPAIYGYMTPSQIATSQPTFIPNSQNGPINSRSEASVMTTQSPCTALYINTSMLTPQKGPSSTDSIGYYSSGIISPATNTQPHFYSPNSNSSTASTPFYGGNFYCFPNPSSTQLVYDPMLSSPNYQNNHI
ncbi:unnamed protein product [Caenorhabditis angaria]|uniref:Cytoplasmic polyadenylation element-binding protein 3 n=1 Tax=Caenorhabditis angaria TaxID=860376 RepID=Q6E3D1_9PELO|nr:CPB-3 [Caenorhabditis angaria]AAT72447.1 CPB-3 [Caenorhabditis angaria]CAI5438998.1 unnamed protein product [Caenorhabditis angaria]